MILVEERLYDELWKRSAMDTSKSHLNDKLHSQLTSSDVPDDVRVKQYQNNLSRFLNIKQKIPNLEPSALNGLIAEPPRKKHKRRKTREGPVRTSEREHVSWSRFGK